MSTQPTPKQLKQIQEALLNAFDHDELKRLTRERLNLHLEWITPVTGKRDLTTIVADLVVYFAGQEGGLKRLLRGSLAENSNNGEIQTLAAKWSDVEFAVLSRPESQSTIQTAARGVTANGDITKNIIVTGDGNTITQQLYQVTDPPPLYVNVPPMPNHFVGREKLIETTIKQLFSGSHLAVSAEGLPGVGKTAIAVALAHHQDVLSHFKDGVLWAGLGPNGDVMSLLGQWGNALGIDLADETSVKDRNLAVKNAIGQRHLLLVIDDVWEIEAANALRCGGPNCCYILTTREQNIARRFAGILHVQTVPILASVPANQLLADLVPEVWATDVEACKALVDRVGRLPLAIELLGGYLATPEHNFFPDLQHEALSKIGEPLKRLELAQQRLGTYEHEQVTLAQTISLSIESLSETAAEAFFDLGAFAPKPLLFSREAALAVTGADSRRLALLVSHNLLEKIDDDWLAFHQIIADTARLKTTIEAQKRHLSYYLAFANKDPNDWHRIELVYGQIKWAWETSSDEQLLSELQLAVDTYQLRRGLWVDQVNWLVQLLDMFRTQDWKTEEGCTFNKLGVVYKNQGRWDEAIQMYEQSLAIKKELGDKHGISQSLMGIGLVCYNQGRWDEAIQMYEQSLAIKKELGDKHGKGHIFNNLGLVYYKQGRWGKALQMYQRNLTICRELGDIHSEGQTLNNLGGVYDNQGKWDLAFQMYERSLAIKKGLGDKYGEGRTLNNLGSIYYSQGRWDEAIQMYEQSLVICRELDDKYGISQSLMGIGLVYKNQGKRGKVLRIYEQSLAIKKELGDKHGESQILNNLGSVFYNQGRWDEAIQMYEQGLAICRELGDKHGEGQTLNNLGSVYYHQGKQEKANAVWQEALTNLRPDSKLYKELSEWLEAKNGAKSIHSKTMIEQEQ